MIVGIICTVVIGVIALYKTLECRAYKRVLESQRAAIDSATDAIVREMAMRAELSLWLMRIRAALLRGEVLTVIAEMQSLSDKLRTVRPG